MLCKQNKLINTWKNYVYQRPSSWPTPVKSHDTNTVHQLESLFHFPPAGLQLCPFLVKSRRTGSRKTQQIFISIPHLLPSSFLLSPPPHHYQHICFHAGGFLICPSKHHTFFIVCSLFIVPASSGHSVSQSGAYKISQDAIICLLCLILYHLVL